jgi:hypothetical protein
MNFFCKVCGTEAQEPTLCSGCGGLMTALTGKHTYAVEIMDMATRTNEPVIYERRGPFNSVLEADSWWHRHSELPRYIGCEAYTVILQAPGEHHD